MMLGWYEKKLVKELVELIHNNAVDEAMYAITLKYLHRYDEAKQKSLLEQHVRANNQLEQEYKKAINRESQRRYTRKYPNIPFEHYADNALLKT